MSKNIKTAIEAYTDSSLLGKLGDIAKYEISEHDWGVYISLYTGGEGFVSGSVLVRHDGGVTYGTAIDLPEFAENHEYNAVMEQAPVKDDAPPAKFLLEYAASLAKLEKSVEAHFKTVKKFSK